MKKQKKKDKAEKAVTDNIGDAEVAKQARAQKRTERRRVVNEDLQMEISTLRQNLNEMLDRYRLKLDAELIRIADASSGNGNLGEATRHLSAGVAESMLKQIRSLDIKPQKGRAKDLQRVQELVGNLVEQLPAEK